MMRRIATLAVLLGVLLSTSSRAAVLGPELQRRLASNAASADVPVVIVFADHGDLSDLVVPRVGRVRAGGMIRSLQDAASSSQTRVLSFLEARGYGAQAKSFWINNSIAVRVPLAVLADLQTFGEIESIDFDVPVVLDGAPAGPSTNSVDWNLSKVRADQVWSSLGYDGTGIVVGSMDTGFDPNHPALAGKWRGGANSWRDIINAQPTPYDDHGHGTHTIGTMVGGDGPGPFPQDIGVAYNAKFISAKVIDANNGFNSASIVIAGAQWMLDPDGDPDTDDFPDVINNSWLFFTPDFIGFHYVVTAWRAAGIIPVFCIGNNGSGGATTAAPGNYDNTIGVGATDSDDLIAYFSSRGPSPTGSGFPLDLRKPEISAPGYPVWSSVPGGGYSYWAGTSMASPHVAGTVALMLQAHPGPMSFDEVRTALLTTSVDLGTPGYDYDYGYGRLDALGAVTAAMVPGIHLAGAAASHDVHLHWNPSVLSGVIRYDIYRSAQIQDVLPPVIGSATDTAFTDPHRFGLGYYRVRAVRQSDQSPFTNEIGITTCGGAAPTCYAVGAQAASPVTADFNGDGHLDVAIANTLTTGIVSVVYGDGAGHFGATSTFPAGNRPLGLATGDFNADGITDLAVADNATAGAVSILIGNGSSGAGDGTFQAPVSYAASSKPMGIVCGDFDQDGITDLAVVGNGFNNVAVLRGNGNYGDGDGTFAPQVAYSVGTRPTGIVTADFNHDGVLDLAAASNGGGRVSVLLGNTISGRGAGTFAPAVHYACGSGAFGITTGDFDADGIIDLAVTREVAAGVVAILRGQGSGGAGDGTFAASVEYAAESLPEGLAAADVNGDGITDLCAANGSTTGVVSVLLGTGSGSTGDGGFEGPVSVSVGSSPGDVAVADFDGNGAPDFAVASVTSQTNLCVIPTACPSDAGTGLAVQTPAGGEAWQGSSWHTIAWSKDPGVISVDIEVSRNAGATWETIAANQIGTSFPWFVDDPSSAVGAARIRISDSRVSAAATSAAFTIAPDVRTAVPDEPRGAVALALAIENPVLDGLRVRFALASHASATLEVLDVSGRSVLRRAVGDLGAGDHVLDLGHGLRAGIYWVRLTQGSRRVMSKAAVLR